MRGLKSSFISPDKAPAHHGIRSDSKSRDAAETQPPVQTIDRTDRLRVMIECEIIPRLMMAHIEPDASEFSSSIKRRNAKSLSVAIDHNPRLTRN
ncbi:hypothetical protein SAMN05444581_11452 [Methylocapsa palsarum]|uniref:Uncharacterized protein n=1 Tax=Methylocapsa palsarum TaxID=1612308 RepID=A0A1I4BCQ7_9HYPH|nr:hypothetical protein SAMN05444581_11452 [Methylocapsa palsarum]